ncbi:DUF262 domain-containing protein [Lapidilactobacillus bayanensis]|uniref:DUF262 domain-containing protein n=1 Tax=Lapidilactobacillus bayanensis TaxID=2485998 RepID=UPI000F7A8F59|nr:DUF262 domain-containing protein [Lapidilactobacillus bayanensis]
MDKKYEVQNNSIGTLLSWIDSDEIELPELQRPFVWPSVKVRDLIDSLYNGFPVGYIIIWNNPQVQLKSGNNASGKKIIIDGQQRMTALKAAISGQEVMDQHFRQRRIKIAFNPFTEAFATTTAAIVRDKQWIPDIALLFRDDYSDFEFIPKFAEQNEVEPREIAPQIQKVSQLVTNDIGNIILSSQLNIQEVTEIFNRINSKGTVLSSADFIMSKLSADYDHEGNVMRKIVEYFTQLLVDPQLLNSIKQNDPEFARSNYFQHINWAAREHSDLYIPNFGDIFHVVLGTEFGRGKHADLIALVSGRDFKTKTYTEDAREATYTKLRTGILAFTNQSNFQRYMMILYSLGMLDANTLALNGTGVLNFGYMLYLVLGRQKMTESQLESIVKKWIVMAAITGRYSGSSETQSEIDIKLFLNSDDPQSVANRIFAQEMVSSFWQVTLPERLVTSATSSNVWRIFQMAQVHADAPIWLEKDHKISSVITEQGNVHHIFPKAYLKKHHFKQSEFNQVANLTWLTQPRNLQISEQAPKVYLADPKITEFMSAANFKANVLPEELCTFDATNYQQFLDLRRHLIAERIKAYFEGL